MYERSNEQQENFFVPQKNPMCQTTKINDFVSPDSSAPLDHGGLQTSFEDNLPDQHAKAIWNASIQFLINSLKIKFDETKGFNDGNIFESDIELKDSLQEQEDIIEILNKNLVLTFEQKNILTIIQTKLTRLKKLMQQIYHLFSQQIFQEITILILQCVNQYMLYKQTLKLSKQFTKFLGPAYTNLDICNVRNNETVDQYEFITQVQISNKAQECGDQIASSFFVSTKIRYLNLKEVDIPLNNSNIVRRQFQKFVQVITKAVFLCSEGCFEHPNQEIFFYSLNNEDSGLTYNSIHEQDQGLSGRKRRNQ